MNLLKETERELASQKKRLNDAGEQVLAWLQQSSPGKLAAEKPWLLAGMAAVLGASLGYLAGQWFQDRRLRKD